MSTNAEPTTSDLTDAELEALRVAWSDWAPIEVYPRPRPLDRLALVVARIKAMAIAAAQEKERARFAAAVEAAFDQGELDCGRLGLPCTAANSSDRWCRACRIRAILDLPGGAA